MSIHLKRIYDEPSEDDGLRVLVDRLWPRGLARDKARVDQWVKQIAPSDELRKWFGHEPRRWEQFVECYGRELEEHAESLEALRKLSKRRKVTLLYAAKDAEHNNAVALKRFLEWR